MIFFLSYHQLFSFNCEEKVIEIYQEILESIGSNVDLPPDLHIISSENKVAFINNNGIFIEKKVIDLFCEQPTFKANIAYVLGHELAHYFLDHNWMKNSGLGYTNSIGSFIDDKSFDKDQRKLAESQADLFGGFYGQIAGYNTLNYASETLSEIYKLYDIPHEINGYPSLRERHEIIKSNQEKAKHLFQIFSIGNVLLSTGHLKQAKDCFEIILKNKFKSREIYNNLGLTYLLFAIKNLAPPFSTLFYPVFLDQQTRLNTGRSRSSGFFGTPEQLLEKSKKFFLLSQSLDPEYLPALQNLKVYEYIKIVTSNMSTKNFLLSLKSNKLDQKTINDFYVLDKLLDKKQLRNKKRFLESGSQVTAYNLGIKEPVNKISEDEFEELLNSNGIKPEAYFFGFERPYESHRFDYVRYKLSMKKFDLGILYDLNDELYIYKRSNQSTKDNYDIEYLGEFYTVANKN